ncbi:MAG: hypothetical protein DCC59_13680 [Chloroflexi bacterium]|nr:MAG: hypothetical protein DCC59_13680 [Chloroflexota bacterium]
MHKRFRVALNVWYALTFLVLASLALIYLRNGMAGLNLFIQQWPLSNLAVTLASTAVSWLSLGALIHLFAYEKINKNNLWLTAGFFLVLFVYLGILRERFRYGDYHYYLEAATALANGLPLPDTYLYPPLWATLLRFLVPLGDQGFMIVLWLVNIVALASFYFLLVKILERYNLSHPLSILIAILFLLVNTPLMKTLGFIQVNLLTMDLILLSLLACPKNAFLSALTLALAVHLKTSPVVIVLAFLLEFNWRWLFWFALSLLAIAFIPAALHGFDVYAQYLNNAVLLAQIPDTNFHDTSFDSFLRFLNPFFGIPIETTRIMALGAKALLLVAALYTMAQNVREKSFSKENRLLNAVPALFVFMTLGSPIVWDHHGLFVSLAFLLLLKRIHNPTHWMFFLAAYFLEFIQPSFDFFPWSYGRLIAPMIVLWLMYATRKETEPSPFIASANQWLAKLTA